MQRCISCILPVTFPGIEFNSSGVCSVCEKYKEQKAYLPSLQKLKVKLDKIINENRSTNTQYDALVAFSGGKDSTYLIYTLKKEYNLKILAFTFDNGFMPDHTFLNIKNVLEKLDVDHLILKPRYDIIKRIFSTSAEEDIFPTSLLKFGSSICISCIRMVTNLSLKTAIEKQIPMVMIGNSPGQFIQSENEIIYKDNRIPYGLKRRLFKPLADKISEDVYYYFLLDKEQYKTRPFPYTINPLPIIGYDESQIYKIMTKLGWKRPDDVDPNSSNCQLNALGIIKHQEKLNFHPYDYEMSMLVRLGIISRDEALRRVEDPTGQTADIAADISEKLS
ncbi:MAG: hypothetical protein HF978_04585 [Desulfobacteraceae bacterium]|nr:7-cyano-7-deazaguanine synthase [Desulfobacteraceae bacterium]MBC2754806.1 hypothetical protein [Desulfobacteraceae bacterium]